jgi:hypothetical protein
LTAEDKTLFTIAARLHLPVTVVESMSHRQITGWIEMFTAEANQGNASAASGDAIDYRSMSKAAKKAAFR